MAIMMFDFDCLNKNRMDLSLAENLVHRGDAPGVIDEWFQVAHLLHERNGKELLRAAAEEAENSANSLQKEQAAGNMAQGGLGKKDPVPKQSGVKRDRSAMNEHNQHQEEEEEAESTAGYQCKAMRETASMKARTKASKTESSVLMNKVRMGEKIHKQIVKNNLVSMNTNNEQILPAIKKMKANSSLQPQAEIAREAASARVRIAGEKQRKQEEAKAAAAKRAEAKQAERSIGRKTAKKALSVVSVRRWERASGKQYALLGAAERETANAEIARM